METSTDFEFKAFAMSKKISKNNFVFVNAFVYFFSVNEKMVSRQDF